MWTMIAVAIIAYWVGKDVGRRQGRAENEYRPTFGWLPGNGGWGQLS